jgi:hypothetical protein
MLEGGGYMDTIAIVLEIDAEISRLQQVKELLTAVKATEKNKPGRAAATTLPKNSKSGRTLSAASRENIAAAQKKRWAKVRKANKAALKTAPAPAAKRKASTTTAAPKTVTAKKAATAKKPAPSKPTLPVPPAL